MKVEFIDIKGQREDYVFLLHALSTTTRSMQPLEDALRALGYFVINLPYPSRKYKIATLADTYLAKAVEKLCVDPKRKVHFVGYSLGAIVIRKYLQDYNLSNLGRVVMIAPPNRGSEMVELIVDSPFRNLYKWWLGPAAQQLGASPDSYVNKELNMHVDYELGIIAGDRYFAPLANFVFAQKNDGLVSLESTKLEGMKDHITIHSSHCFIASNRACINQVMHFLAKGVFSNFLLTRS